MKESVKVFVALAAVIAGTVCVVCYVIVLATTIIVAPDYVPLAFLGVLLIAGGATYFWIKRRSHEG